MAKHSDMIEMLLFALRLVANEGLFELRSTDITLLFDKTFDPDWLSCALFESVLLVLFLKLTTKLDTTTLLRLKNSFM